MQDKAIRGGYILLARKLFDSWLTDKPPLYWKMWIWMLGQANWKDRGQLKKGQFVTTTAEMQEAMSYRIGYRKKTPTRAEIRSSYEAFTNNHMISLTKSTRGTVVTVENFGKYQDFKSYEQHTEQPREDTTNNQAATQDTEGIGSQEGIKPNTPPISPLSFGEAGKVKLTAEEHAKLVERFGEKITADYIERLDNYIASKGKKYKSHYHTILVWQRRDEKEAKQGGAKQHQPRKSKMDEVEDRLNAWVGGADGAGMDQADDSRDDDGSNIIQLEKLATGQFGR